MWRPFKWVGKRIRKAREAKVQRRLDAESDEATWQALTKLVGTGQMSSGQRSLLREITQEVPLMKEAMRGRRAKLGAAQPVARLNIVHGAIERLQATGFNVKSLLGELTIIEGREERGKRVDSELSALARKVRRLLAQKGIMH